MSSMSGIWRSSLQSRRVFWHSRLTHLSSRHCSNSSKCVVGSTGQRNTHELKHHGSSVGCLPGLHSELLDNDIECAHLNQEGHLPRCHNAHKSFPKLGKDTCFKFNTAPRQIPKLGTISKNNTLLPNTYSTHLNITFLLSQAPRIFSTSFIRNFSSQPEDPDLHDQMKTDPELKAWMQEISKDFKSNPQPSAENEEEEETTSSSDSSSDSSSSSSDSSSSDSDFSSSDSSDSEPDESKAVKSPDAPGPSAHLHTNPLDALTKVDIAAAALSDANVDGTVHEEDDEDELEEEEEYEDFYHDFEDDEEVMPQRHLPISLDRGATGVYDIEELVTLLIDENARDVCVMAIPADYKYVDHMVVVTGRSTRHLRAMAELIRWVYKQKRSRRDPKTVKIEGELTQDWMALDLGNIAVHLFLEEARAKYDLETLWTVGSDFDSKTQEEELDPFALFVDQAWTGFRLETEPEPKATPPTHNQASMDSLAGWHGGSNSTTR